MQGNKLPEKSRRRFSKRLIMINIFMAWTVMCLTAVFGNVEVIAPHILAFIVTITGIYTGVGHLDLRKTLDVTQ